MAFQFAKPSDFQGGAYFKPADHMTDLALLIEPLSIEKGVESEYQGKIRHRDEVTANITIFRTSESIETGTPTEVQKGVRVVHGMLTSTLERVLGGVTVAIIRKVPTKNGSGYAFRDVENGDHLTALGAYYEAREASIAEAMADVPDFA